ncbi:hypothetical protein ColTof4_10085 [Colletotrichum tofieldiae]|uniref:Secreted protein n=1 Tax=Colletotrichum liriopes TaxID=708192 RepID=A0AA37GKU4_9PEZI|nr:hypothetical protein ColLi_05014 [Colletotrichum liriopes]GKT58914.1 hypothetical protein ColTof3_06253 [Colletotrichum tofieldiae]GKT77662.1 hypothetical protein ColTof4_10085 [Colletotrichum tofieldiae]GKT85047.1 hypothetical protein Ct61P_02897 [Colletotrichum tofieldiae]
MSFSLMTFCCMTFRASLSIVIVDNSAVRAVTVLGGRAPTLAIGWIEYLARMRCDVVGPRAKKDSSAFCGEGFRVSTVGGWTESDMSSVEGEELAIPSQASARKS